MRITIALRILCVPVLAPAYASARQSQASTAKTITILQLNDAYQIAPVDRRKRDGLARTGTLQKQIRTGSPNTLFLLSGDFISPSFASRLFKGKQMVAVRVNAYILGGGDGYDFKGGEVLIAPENGPLEPDVVMEAVKKLGTIAPQVEGRIKSAQVNQKSALLPNRRFASAAVRSYVAVSAR